VSSGADAVAWLVSGVENLNLDGKAWAGASHWRYRTRQNPDADPDVVDLPAKPAKKSAGRWLPASSLRYDHHGKFAKLFVFC
jgi:hypothetical protein